jgi:hypothetical protein
MNQVVMICGESVGGKEFAMDATAVMEVSLMSCSKEAFLVLLWRQFTE